MRKYGYLAFIVGLCLTAWACLFVRSAQDQQIAATFQRDSDKIARDTTVRLQTYFDLLRGIRGMYAVNGEIRRDQFVRYVRELDLGRRYPGFQAIQLVREVANDDLARYADAVRHDTSVDARGYPQFQIHPAGAQPQHFVIEYTEPLKGNENAFGLDLGALPPHLKALQRGRDSGEIVATERIALVQDARNEPGFVARAPLYRDGLPLQTVEQRRAALAGFVAIVFRVDTLMRAVIDNALLDHMYVRIHDTGYIDDAQAQPPAAANLMFDSAGKAGAARLPPLPGLSASATLNVGQRRWQIEFDGHAGARYSRGPFAVPVIGLAGLLISTLIAALLVALQRRRELAEKLVDARYGLEHSLTELEQQKANVEKAHADLSAVLATLKQAQTNLITSEKMASLGALVAGIAHELNTPIGNSLLTATALSDMVITFERALSAGGIKRSALEEHLSKARQACDIMAVSLSRAAELITSFKQMAVDQSSGQRRRFLMAEVLHDTLATYAAQLRRAGVQVDLEVDPALELDSYPGSVSQVLSNLINNALLHAFDGRESGTLHIAARRDGDNAVLAFRDDGAGMSARVLHQIFDPFFTTKMGQGGSGLGMNIVYNIITSVLRGTIRIESEPGQGTCITLVLPLSVPERAPEEALAVPHRPSTAQTGSHAETA